MLHVIAAIHNFWRFLTRCGEKRKTIFCHGSRSGHPILKHPMPSRKLDMPYCECVNSGACVRNSSCHFFKIFQLLLKLRGFYPKGPPAGKILYVGLIQELYSIKCLGLGFKIDMCHFICHNLQTFQYPY